jgi:hypothetical protein
VPDGASVYSVGNQFIVKVSPKQFPWVVMDEADANRRAKLSLSSDLASFIIDPVVSDRLSDGRSFVVFPQGKPLSNNRFRFTIQKRRAKLAMLGWLRGVAGCAAPPSLAAKNDFRKSLEALGDLSLLPQEIRGIAKTGAARLSNPRFCLMHGDLWKGNIIMMPDKSFKIIDWRGSLVNGYGFFDLLNFAHSFEVKNQELEIELRAHALAMNIPSEDALIYVLAGCGHILRHLEEFPLSHFIRMVLNLWSTMRSV